MTKAKGTASKRPIAWGRYLLVFFVAAWMFVLGVLVGRGTAPVHFDTQALQKELAELRDAMMQKEREAVEKAMRGEDEQAPLEFYEALKTDKPDTAVRIPPAQALPDETAAPASAPADATPPHKSRIALKPKQAAAGLKPAPVPADAVQTPAAAAGQLTIQVASMKDGAAAERIVANLKRKGYPSYLSRIVIPDKGVWYRVRVGSYRDRTEAASDMARLTRDQNSPILVEK